MIECYDNIKKYVVRHEKGDFSLEVSEAKGIYTAVFHYGENYGKGEFPESVSFSAYSMGDLLADYNKWMRRSMNGTYRLYEVDGTPG